MLSFLTFLQFILQQRSTLRENAFGGVTLKRVIWEPVLNEDEKVLD